MIETKDKTIGGVLYRVSQLGALTGRGVLVRLVKLVGGGLVGALVSGGLKGLDRGALATSLGKVVDGFSEEDLAYFCDLFSPLTQVITRDKAGKQLNQLLANTFDLHFAGKYREMGQWLLFALEVNFGSVFQGLAVAAPRDAEQVTAPESA